MSTAHEVKHFDRIILIHDNEYIEPYLSKKYGEVLYISFEDLIKENHLLQNYNEVRAITVALEYLEEQHNYFCDIVAMLDLTAPLSSPEDLKASVNSLLVHKVDSVISVYEDNETHYLHGEYGLSRINNLVDDSIQLEREALYVFNGTVRVSWRDVITIDSFLGKKIGHTIVPKKRSFRLQDKITKHVLHLLLGNS